MRTEERRQRFFMVVGQGTPTKKHSTRIAAFNEAERLAAFNPNQEFHVVESLATVASTASITRTYHERLR